MIQNMFTRFRRLFVTQELRLGSGASVLAEVSPNTWRTITPKELAQIVDPPARGETLTAAKTLTSADDGKTYFLGAAGGFTVTLPAPYVGGKFRFRVSVAPTTAYIIVTGSSANILRGGVNELEVDTGDDGPYQSAGDTFTFVANVAVVGDFVEMESDGTYWYLNGQTNADGGSTVTQAS